MKEKRLFLFMAVLITVLLLMPVNAQDLKIGLTVTPLGQNTILEKSLMGAAGHSGNGFYIVGLTCQLPLTSRFDVETGLEYVNHTIKISPNLLPGMDDTPYKASSKLVSIPVTLKMDFLKYLFVNGGCLLDIDTKPSRPIHNQTGIGAMLGIGIKYDFKFGGTIFANPYARCHSLVPFFPERYPQRLFDSGVRFGITYDFSKISKKNQMESCY